MAEQGVGAEAVITPERLPAEEARLAAIAADPKVTPDELAYEGAEALMVAARNQAPSLITPAARMLHRVVLRHDVLHEDPDNYLGASLALAFRGAHHDWASGNGLQVESIEEAHEELIEIIRLTLPQQGNPHFTYLLRATYMGLITRKKDPNYLVFPTPPSIQFDNSKGAVRHNAFAAVDSELIPCDLEMRAHDWAIDFEGLLNIYVADELNQSLRILQPKKYRKLMEDRPRVSVRLDRALRHVARLILEESEQGIAPHDISLLKKTSNYFITMLKREAEARRGTAETEQEEAKAEM